MQIGDYVRILIDLHDGEGTRLEPCRVIEFNDMGDVITIELEHHRGRVKSKRLGIDTTNKKMQLVWLTGAVDSIYKKGQWVSLAQKSTNSRKKLKVRSDS